jgi:endonuclease YncB( thermonuclease family)
MTIARRLGLALGLSMRLVTADSQAEAVMNSAVECTVLAFTTAGELQIAIGDVPRAVRLPGVVVPPETRAEVNTRLERLRQRPLPSRCTVAANDAAGVAWATVEYLAWRDKSGDVWEDLGATLIEEGLALVEPRGASAREEYLVRERKARAARRGLWAKEPGQ